MARSRLGELLISRGMIDEDQLRVALAHQKQWDKKIGACFVHLGFVKEIDLYKILSETLKFPIVNVTKIHPEKMTPELLQYVGVKSAQKSRIVPVALRDFNGKMKL